MNPSLASHRGDAGTRLQRCRYEPLLLLGAPAAATLHRGDDFNRCLAHVTIPMNSHMTHTLRARTSRPLPDGYFTERVVALRTPSAGVIFLRVLDVPPTVKCSS